MNDFEVIRAIAGFLRDGIQHRYSDLAAAELGLTWDRWFVSCYAGNPSVAGPAMAGFLERLARRLYGQELPSGLTSLDQPGRKFLFAGRAIQADDAVKNAFLEHRFDPLVEARLAEVVIGFRALRDVSSGKLFSLAGAHHKASVGDFDQRVFGAVCKFLLRVGQFACQIEILLLQGKEMGVVREEAVLCLENLLVELRNDGRQLVEVPESNGGFQNIPGSAEGAVGGGEH